MSSSSSSMSSSSSSSSSSSPSSSSSLSLPSGLAAASSINTSSLTKAFQKDKVNHAANKTRRTFEDTVKYVISVAPSMKPTTASTGYLASTARQNDPSSRGADQTPLPPAHAAAIQAAVTAALAAFAPRAPYAAASASAGNNTAAGATSPPSKDPPANGATCYCFKHGWNWKHDGAICDFLKALPDTPSRARKMAAKHPRIQVDGKWGNARQPATSITPPPPVENPPPPLDATSVGSQRVLGTPPPGLLIAEPIVAGHRVLGSSSMPQLAPQPRSAPLPPT
ncbi:unnamed protein product, partial [Sphagnum compactum]